MCLDLGELNLYFRQFERKVIVVLFWLEGGRPCCRFDIAVVNIDNFSRWNGQPCGANITSCGVRVAAPIVRAYVPTSFSWFQAGTIAECCQISISRCLTAGTVVYSEIRYHRGSSPSMLSRPSSSMVSEARMNWNYIITVIQSPSQLSLASWVRQTRSSPRIFSAILLPLFSSPRDLVNGIKNEAILRHPISPPIRG